MSGQPLSLSELRRDPDRLYTTTEAARMLGKSKAWFERHRWAGTGPRYVKVGRTPYYTARDLLVFVAGTTVPTPVEHLATDITP